MIRKGKGKEARLNYLAIALMVNRHALLIGIDVRHATGTGEHDGALALVNPMGRHRPVAKSIADLMRHARGVRHFARK